MISKNKKKPGPSGDLSRLLIALVSFVVLFVMLAIAVTPSRYNISEGDYAPATIKANKDITDWVTTNKNKEAAARAVPRTKYMLDDEQMAVEAGKAVDAAKATFAKLDEIKQTPKEDELSDEEYLESVNEQLKPFNLLLGAEQLSALKNADYELLDALYDSVYERLREEMTRELLDTALDEALGGINEQLLSECGDETLVSLIMSVAEQNLKSNAYYNDSEWETKKEEARDKTPEVKYQTGQKIVADGEKIDEAQYALLVNLNLVAESELDIWLYIGIALLLITLIGAEIIYLRIFEKAIYKSPKRLLIISLVCVLTLLISILTKQIDISVGETKVFVMPVALGVLMLSLLVSRRVALFTNVPLSIMASMLSGSSGSFFNINTYTIVISAFVSGCVALLVIKNRQTRLYILLAGLVAGVAGVLATFSVSIISTSGIKDSLIISLYSGISGPGSAIICIALMPAFEALFNVITNTRLVEMSNPNHPLLRRLLLEAPGTYHHSIIVANLAEAAAGEIGANSLLARVGSYYHDIGKLVRPQYFTENQMGDNPHDRTDPRVSTAIITAHPRDGAQLLKEKHMPEEIKNIALTHHGDTPVVYFYNKALTENGEANVEDFRYPGPRPSTKEEAVVMMADSVEAATRSITNPDRERVREIVEKLVSQKIDDGQLDDCDISFRDISRIINAFVTVLSGAFHERIEYPNVEIPKKHNEEEPKFETKLETKSETKPEQRNDN